MDVPHRVTAVSYHAHLLGRAMYTTLLREVDEEANLIRKQAAAASAGPVYQGYLTEEEDARNIWFEHPIEESDQCIFPVENYVIVEGVMSRQPRNCPESSSQDGEEAMKVVQQLCYGMPSSDHIEFLEDDIAGYTCEGGIYDQKDSNE